MARLRDLYRKVIVESLTKEYGYRNRMAVPRLEKVVLNMGLGEAIQTSKVIDSGLQELALITGQKGIVTRARKSVAAFKLREGMPIGVKVTLRGNRMYEFLDRLVSIALPRVADFRGLSRNAFDGRGNYTLGLKDQLLFPEIDYTKVEKARGMNVTIITTARTDGEALSLLTHLGMPFTRN
jgi:large subunit ribosomal protein L5